MSLINRMLRDLSARERRNGDVLSGIEVPQHGARRGPQWGRLFLLLGLVAFFTTVIWLLLPTGPRPAAQAPATSVLPGAPPAATAGQTAPSTASKLQLDTTLSQVPAAPSRPRAARRSSEPAPPATTLQAAPELRTAPPPPPPVQVAAPRDTKAAVQRHAEARTALQRGEDRSAEEALLAALALDPYLHAAREDLGTLYVRHGRLDEAERAARTGLELSPQWIGYRRLAARLELARNNGAAAVALLEREPPTVAGDPEYHGLLASAYQRVGRHDAAARTYQNLAQLQPGVAQWWAGFGLSRDALGDAPGALSAYTQARTLGGLDARVLEHINRRSAALSAGE
jgi:MSHA biogenesis protein MshN